MEIHDHLWSEGTRYIEDIFEMLKFKRLTLSKPHHLRKNKNSDNINNTHAIIEELKRFVVPFS